MAKSEQMHKSILTELIERRVQIFDELREREPERIAKWLQLNAAIAGIEAESGRVIRHDEYSGFRKPNQALFAYLDKVQKPQNREIMCKALANGGYGRGTPRPYWDLIRAIDYQIDKEKKPTLKEINGLVGRIEWPKELFNAKNAPPS